MIEQDLQQLHEMSMVEIKRTFSQYFNCKAPHKSKDFFVFSIAYRMQELEFGGLPTATRTLLSKMYVKKPQKTSKKTVAPIGTKIIKNYKGKDYTVRVVENGFDLNGQQFKTLSGMAKKITGMKISGNLFFGLGKRSK